ncbi:MAG: MerR family transcriptional regulator [Actinophytocola sp.]|uniref:MerR family transcriptional regulator n=1 Tax=Actinophytocola sp. TaxID=1872138 RepID=UPI003C7431D2
MSDELYTLEQLSERVADLLADDYDGQRSGRVRELPNGRTIRWYTTIGLVDRPLATRGRVALYGERHALQLAAIKKLQARGLALAEVQERLLGATNAELTVLAEVKANVAVDIGHGRNGDAPEPGTVTNVVPAFRIDDTVTVVLDGVTRNLDHADIAELTTAAAPLLDALERLGLTPRKERR